MSAYWGLRSRAFSLIAVFAALLLSMSFTHSATAAGGNGASDKVDTSGVEAYAKPGKGKATPGKNDDSGSDTEKGNKGGPGGNPSDPQNLRICHWTGEGFLEILPADRSHSNGDDSGEGHENHEFDVILAPTTDGGCASLTPPDGSTPDPACGDEGVSVDPVTGEDCDPEPKCGDAGVTLDPVTGEECDPEPKCGDPGVTLDPVTGEECDPEPKCGDAGVSVDPVTGEDCDPAKGGGKGPGGVVDPVTDPVENPDKGGTPGKPGEGTDGKTGGKDKPGKDGVKPIIKPGDKTPVVKGVEKKKPTAGKPGTGKPGTGKPTTGTPATQPQTGSSPNAGVPHAVAAGLAPAGKKSRPAMVLPNTGLEDHLGVLTAGGLALLLMGGVLVAPRRRSVRVAR